jgi:hypothetical protein
MVEYFEDNTAIVEVTGAAGKPAEAVAVMKDGTILISPRPTTIGLALSNPRNFTVRQELLGVNAGDGIVARQTASDEIEVAIDGAEEGKDYNLTLHLQSPDGLRDFTPYTLALKCVSFETAVVLQNFTVNNIFSSLDFAPNKTAFTVKVPYSTDYTLEGTTLNPGASLTIYSGTDDSGTVLATGTHTAKAPPQSLPIGDNNFYIKIENFVWQQTYTVTVKVDPGIIIGITNSAVQGLTFNGVPSSVAPGTLVTITITGGVTPDSWYVSGMGPAPFTAMSCTFNASSTPGFYNVNVIARVGSIDYSGSFGLTVDQ